MLGKRKQLLLGWLFFLALSYRTKTFLGLSVKRTLRLKQLIFRKNCRNMSRSRMEDKSYVQSVYREREALQLYSSTKNQLAFGVTRPDLQDGDECAASIWYSKTCDLAIKWHYGNLLLNSEIISSQKILKRGKSVSSIGLVGGQKHPKQPAITETKDASFTELSAAKRADKKEEAEAVKPDDGQYIVIGGQRCSPL
uniref:Uncharacterized protein n=1 Tax=Ditylenchus dipsaci TaxID=166011 RepID=A0A915EP37_9BILA